MAAATQGWANWSNRARPAPRKIAASRSTRQVTAIDCNQWGRPSGECTAHYFETVSDFDVTELLPGERIRDKIAASKRKGLWVGGMVPLGYESRERRLVIHEQEAERVRSIFQRYLELGSIGRLLADLRGRGILTKVRRRRMDQLSAPGVTRSKVWTTLATAEEWCLVRAHRRPIACTFGLSV